jgi:hypothetical protein
MRIAPLHPGHVVQHHGVRESHGRPVRVAHAHAAAAAAGRAVGQGAGLGVDTTTFHALLRPTTPLAVVCLELGICFAVMKHMFNR